MAEPGAGWPWCWRSVMAASLLAACGGNGRTPIEEHRPAPRPTRPRPSSSMRPSRLGRPAAAPKVQWSACRGAAGPKGLPVRHRLDVPRDPSHPGGAVIGMAIDRHRAPVQKIGSLLVNPGGPGVSGWTSCRTRCPDAGQPAGPIRHRRVRSPGVDSYRPDHLRDRRRPGWVFPTDPEPTTPAGFAALVTASRTLRRRDARP